MKKDIVLISGALATPEFWLHQENYFQNSHAIHHINPWGSDSIIEIAEKFSKNAPDECTLIGFSMGGYIALELFKFIPKKIKKLILINSGAKMMSPKGIKERERSLELIEQGKFDLLVKLLFKNSIHDTNKHQILLPQLRQMAYEIGAKNYRDQLLAMLNKPDHTSLLSTITCPTLILVGKHDQIMPPHWSEHLSVNIAGSQLITMEHCGHMAPLEQPDLVNQYIEEWI